MPTQPGETVHLEIESYPVGFPDIMPVHKMLLQGAVLSLNDQGEGVVLIGGGTGTVNPADAKRYAYFYGGC
jgi:hypothetical protein